MHHSADCTPFVDGHGKLHLAMAAYADILQWPFFPPFLFYMDSTQLFRSGNPKILAQKANPVMLEESCRAWLSYKAALCTSFSSGPFNFFMHHSCLLTMTWIELAFHYTEGLLLSECSHI